MNPVPPLTPVPSLPRRIVSATVVVIGVLLVPAALVGLVAGPVAAGAFPFGAIGGLAAANGDGRRVALWMLPLASLGGAAVGATVGSWAWVGLLAALGALVGWLTCRGRAVAITEVAIVAVSVGHLSEWRSLLTYAVFCALGFLYGVLVARLAGAAEFVRKPPVANVDPARAALLGALGLAAAGAITLQLDWVRPFWLPASLLVLLQLRVTREDNGWRSISRNVIGTFLGVALLVPLVYRLPPVGQSAAVVVLLIAGIAVARTVFWLSAALMSAAIVAIATGAQGDPFAIGDQRFGAIAIGFLLLLVVVAALRWVRSPAQPTPVQPTPT